MLSLAFFVSAFDVISSISAVDMFANLCLFIFLLGSVSVTNFFGKVLHFQSPCYLYCFLPSMCTGWSMSIEAKSSFSFPRL